MSPLQTALGYISRGWSPIPVAFKSKRVLIDEWQHLRINTDTAPQHFNGHTQNIGIILGTASAGLTDVDLDCEEAVAVARYFLPKTDATFGRPTSGETHFLYNTELANDGSLGAAITFKDRSAGPIGGEMLVELRIGGEAAGAQTVFPGSVHESGEPIKWFRDASNGWRPRR
jgi:hypothetical protein